MTSYQTYHPHFRQRRREILAAFAHKCFRCGIANRTLASTKDGEVYIVYLHIAHVFRNEKMVEDAPVIPLCPRCHWYFDHPRGDSPEGVQDWFFIGHVARYFIEQEGKKLDTANQQTTTTAGAASAASSSTGADGAEIPMEHLS